MKLWICSMQLFEDQASCQWKRGYSFEEVSILILHAYVQ